MARKILAFCLALLSLSAWAQYKPGGFNPAYFSSESPAPRTDYINADSGGLYVKTRNTTKTYFDTIIADAVGGVASTRQVISGAGLTGGGDLSADRTFAVGAGTGITVNADDVQLSTIANSRVFANISGGAAVPSANTLTAILDAILGNTSGRFVQRVGSWLMSAYAFPAAISGAGTVLRSNATDYVASTSTFADTYLINTLLYNASANTVSGLATANSGVLVTSAGGVPSISTDIPTAVTIGGNYVYRAGGTDVPLLDGGTNASLTASNGGIFYSSASAGAILAGTATALQMLQSGASATPAWSTSTWPATTTINRLLWSSAANVISDLATGNNGVLITSSGGVPSISSTIPSATQDNITRLGTIANVGAAIGAAYGGTGQSSYAIGDLLYASGSTAISKLADVAAGSYLRSGGVTTAEVWSTLILPNSATANRVPYATSTNTWGDSANLTFDGSTLTVTGAAHATGATTLDGAVNLGDATGDDLTATGRWASGLTPKTDNTYALGTGSLRWSDLQANTGTFGGAVGITGTLTESGAANLNGNVSLGDAAGDSISCPGTLSVTGPATFNSTAGFVGAVALTAGTASGQGGVGCTLKTDTTQVGNVGGGEDNLMSYTIAASTLATNNDTIHFKIAGSMASAGSHIKEIKVYFGATVLVDSGVLAVAAFDWEAEGDIMRTGSGAQIAVAHFSYGTTLGGTTVSTPAEICAGTIVLKATGTVTGTASDNDITERMAIIDWKSHN